MTEQEHIVGVAIYMKEDGIVHTLPKPNRHHNIIWMLAPTGKYKLPIFGEQGFITNTGRFVDRIEARKIAEAANQLIERARDKKQLYSEDVW